MTRDVSQFRSVVPSVVVERTTFFCSSFAVFSQLLSHHHGRHDWNLVDDATSHLQSASICYAVAFVDIRIATLNCLMVRILSFNVEKLQFCHYRRSHRHVDRYSNYDAVRNTIDVSLMLTVLNSALTTEPLRFRKELHGRDKLVCFRRALVGQAG
jgi:hypothetical protein